MKLQLKEVQTALAKLINHYPEAGHNSKTIIRLADDWLDLLSEDNVTSNQFSQGVRWSVKNCRFFPKVADVLEGVRIHRTAIPTVLPMPKVAQIEESTTDGKNWTEEELARNKERISHILAMLSREKTMDQAVSDVERCGNVKEFGK